MNLDFDNNENLLNEEQEQVFQEEQEQVSQEEQEQVSQEELEQVSQEEQEQVSQEEQEQVSQVAFSSVDYSQDFLILENIGYFQLFFTGTLAIFFVLWLVYRFFKSFF